MTSRIRQADVLDTCLKIGFDNVENFLPGNGTFKPAAKCRLNRSLNFFPPASACPAIAMICRRASAVVIPVFLRLWVSLAETPMQNMSTPQANPRSNPFWFRTNPERVT